MKHRIRKTGEFISVISFNGDTARTNFDSVSYIDSKGRERKEPYNYYWDLEEVEESKEIDWEQRRYEIAKEVLAGLFANSDTSFRNTFKSFGADKYISVVQIADRLIEQLKKK